ncbi:MAG: putative ATP synthase YscN [Chlamydiales bacterium]|nr:putative ATP synthase YscN [Chlamydiales bacterium]
MSQLLEKEIKRIQKHSGPRLSGRVTHVIGLLIESSGPEVFVGEVCYVYSRQKERVLCQVVGFKERKVLLMSLGELDAISPGAEVYPTGTMHKVAVTEALCGRILDGLGKPIDGKGELFAKELYPVMAPPPAPLGRQPIEHVLETKIKAIDALCTLGKGQRIGIFSAPGVGKSTLMGMIAKTARADINVIALIGERGREVREFIERELGPEGLARSVVVVATSDQAALLRSKGANVATAIAEYFRDQGKDVILMMDSISRYAMALREIGLAIGEPPTTRGYPPSVFANLPRLLERAGNSEKGSITGIYTILTEEEEMHDPLPDQMRSLLDGHLQLSQDLASANHFPPIHVLRSLSRVMPHITANNQQLNAKKLRALLHIYSEAEELIHLGAYANGSNQKIDEAISKKPSIHEFLKQDVMDPSDFEQTLTALEKVVSK